jgi:CMP-N-acetylneuraminic acid synthetase
MKEILPHDTTQVEPNAYLQIYGTNLLLKIETTSRATQTFSVDYPTHDSLFSVTCLQPRLYDRHGQAINHDPNVLLQTQDLPPVYEENFCKYIFTRENLAWLAQPLGERSLMFEVDTADAWDIDEELDFTVTDFLMRQRSK